MDTSSQVMKFRNLQDYHRVASHLQSQLQESQGSSVSSSFRSELEPLHVCAKTCPVDLS